MLAGFGPSRRLWLLLLAAAVCALLLSSACYCMAGAVHCSSHSHQPEPNPASIRQLLVAGPLDGCSRRMQSTLPILTAHGHRQLLRGFGQAAGPLTGILRQKTHSHPSGLPVGVILLGVGVFPRESLNPVRVAQQLGWKRL
jgi:predicted cobalt transporter CbtA